MKYKVTGKGKVIVMIHGFLNDHRAWKPVLKYLKGYRFILPDLPYHGGSKGKVSLRSMSNGLNRILRGVKEYVLIGHSLGGMVALYHALRDKRVKGLVMVNSAAYYKPKLERGSLKELSEMDFFELLANILRMKRVPFIQYLELITGFDLRGELKGFNTPTLIIASKYDPLVPKSLCYESAKLMGAKVELIEAGHNSIAENPRLVAQKIRGFLKWLRY
ncbi:MAG TPA: alpha/beta hydrolase [Candidatus Aenigmarchaeota archaeon]|nr:alpha/beta hydrolase [Candidatus Aenigmarchaeota archaeon]